MPQPWTDPITRENPGINCDGSVDDGAILELDRHSLVVQFFRKPRTENKSLPAETKIPANPGDKKPRKKMYQAEDQRKSL